MVGSVDAQDGLCTVRMKLMLGLKLELMLQPLLLLKL